MAISKITHMKDCGNSYHGKHLKASIKYITSEWKTQEGRLVGVYNCLPEKVFEQMRETKRLFDKNSGRQGYHIVLSFKPGEVDADTAFEIAGKFVKQYLGANYEVIYSIHDNTDCIHAHVVWNSVSFIDGRKFHYKKGDWEKEILPITNELCREYGLSILELDGERANDELKEWNRNNTGVPKWNDMIKRDIDACIIQAVSYHDFKQLLLEKGYEWKEGKHAAVKPPGMGRFRRLDSLGDFYSEEQIRMRIPKENIGSYKDEKKHAQIVRCRIKKYRKAKLSGLQKKYYARMYRIGLLKKRPYSQAWRYRDEIDMLQKIQKQYLFLNKHDVKNVEELVGVIYSLKEKDAEMKSERKDVYKERQRFLKLFEIGDRMKELENAHLSFLNGDNFFVAEENQWISYEEEIKKAGYSYEEVQMLKEHIHQKIATVIEREAAVKRELATGNSIWHELEQEENKKALEEKEKKKRNEDRTQPIR